MDYRDEVFLKVAENLSFSKAANDLFISQPAVTNHIKELENKLEIALFERKGNRIILTKSGKITYNHLKKISQLYRDLVFDLEIQKGFYKGIIRIGASSTISHYIIPKVIASFHKRYPNIEFFLLHGNSAEMEAKLLRNEIDMALVENEKSHNNLKYINFLDDEIIVITGCDNLYSKRKTLTIAEFKETPLVLREKGSGTLQVINNALFDYGIDVNKLKIFIHLGSTEAIKSFLCDFNGLALVSERAVMNEIRKDEIKKITIKNFSINRKFRIVLRQGSQGASTKLFTDFLLHYNL